jgi:hypothetical protein
MRKRLFAMVSLSLMLWAFPVMALADTILPGTPTYNDLVQADLTRHSC